MFAALEMAHEQHECHAPNFQNYPFFEGYCGDPRFQALLVTMNLA